VTDIYPFIIKKLIHHHHSQRNFCGDQKKIHHANQENQKKRYFFLANTTNANWLNNDLCIVGLMQTTKLSDYFYRKKRKGKTSAKIKPGISFSLSQSLLTSAACFHTSFGRWCHLLAPLWSVTVCWSGFVARGASDGTLVGVGGAVGDVALDSDALLGPVLMVRGSWSVHSGVEKVL
jgi:hypothetical protein